LEGRVKPKPTRAPLDWSLVQAFLAIADTGAVARAASQLDVGHATVVRRLSALEAAVGTKLFDRQSTAYVLTPAGASLRSDLADMAGDVGHAYADVRGADEALRGAIRLTTSDTLFHGVLGPHLRAFCDQHPGVRLDIAFRLSYDSLSRREADVAICGTNTPPDAFLGRSAGVVRFAAYASQDVLQRAGTRALEALDWVGTDDTLAHLDQSKWVRTHVAPERVVMRVDSLCTMADAVAAGIGAGLLPCPLADARPGLERLAEPEPTLETQVWVLSHPDLRQVSRIRAFTQAMYDALRVDPRLQSGRAP
jgi:DNA-binding transcriptional LysR family regulator